MSDVVISLSENLLRLTFFGKNGFGGVSSAVTKDVVEGSQIKDITLFADIVADLLDKVSPSKVRKGSLNFLVEPQDVLLEFITVSKNGGDTTDQIIAGIAPKLRKGDNLENYYFSYQKIAPFIYQFVGVSKTHMDAYLEIANLLNMTLKSVVPWVLLLPKLVNNNQPSIFVAKDNEKQVVALSELNGVYFAGVYEKEKTQEELQYLVQKLSLYNRVTPITKLYTVNYDSFTLDPNYEVLPLEVPGEPSEETAGYELHLLFNNVITSMPNLLSTQHNLLNLLPVPVVTKRQLSLVQVGAVGVIVLVLSVGGYFVAMGVRSQGSTSLDSGAVAGTTSTPSVLHDISESSESTELTLNATLNKADLKIRVENGAGIAGVAGKTRDLLQEAGYDVVSIGDANEFDRQDTLVKFKTSHLEYRDLLLGDLADKYEVVLEEDLDDSLDYDVLIIVGAS